MPELDTGFDLSFVKDIPEDDLQAMIEAVQNGARTPADAMGFDAAALNNIEQIAIALYRARRFREASSVYYFLLRMNRDHVSAWRGLGACAHAQKNLPAAALAYSFALARDPHDLIAAVYWGETLCAMGDRENGVAVLKTAERQGAKDPKYRRYLLRARAIIAAGGGIPTQVILPPKAQARAAEAEAAGGGGEPAYEYNPEQPLTIEQMRKNPDLRPLLKDLDSLRNKGRVTLAEIAGFTQKEFDGAYAAAVKLLEAGQISESLALVGYLMFIHPYQPRYYQLAAINFQRFKQYEAALEYYDMALVLEKDEPRSLVFSGECHIYCGRADTGLAIIRQGLEAAGAKAEHDDVVKRAKVLLKQFGREDTQ